MAPGLLSDDVGRHDSASGSGATDTSLEQRVTGGTLVQLQLGTYQFTGAAILSQTPILSARVIGESETCAHWA